MTSSMHLSTTNPQRKNSSDFNKALKAINEYFPEMNGEYFFEDMCFQTKIRKLLLKKLEEYKNNITSFCREIAFLRGTVLLTYKCMTIRYSDCKPIERMHGTVEFLRTNHSTREKEGSVEESMWLFFQNIYTKAYRTKAEFSLQEICESCVSQVTVLVTKIRDFVECITQIFKEEANGAYLIRHPSEPLES